jgi:hypothetical protein
MSIVGVIIFVVVRFGDFDGIALLVIARFTGSMCVWGRRFGLLFRRNLVELLVVSVVGTRLFQRTSAFPNFVSRVRGRNASSIQRRVIFAGIVLGTDLVVLSRCASFLFVHLGVVIHRAFPLPSL